MTEFEYIENHIDNNAQALQRIILIVADALPHTQQACADLMETWHEINSEINQEFRAKRSNVDGHVDGL